MFMRKFRKNFKGDSLIEVITAFAIISIVGLITISGVVTSGRIKVQTNHIKNASYKADEALQEQSMYENMVSDSVKIYNAADYNISTKSANTGSSSILTKSAVKFSASGTDGGRTQGYKYYDMGVTSNTPNDDDGSSGGKGNFGMSGQWFLRFYLDPTVKMPTNFYVELRLSKGMPGASGTIDVNKTSCIAGGVQYYYTDDGNTKGICWFYKGVNNSYMHTKNQGTCIKDNNGDIVPYLNNETISFDNDGRLSLYWKYNRNKVNNVTIKTDFQIFDISFYWSSLTAYDISLHIINADTGEECVADDGSSIMDRFTVYARNFGKFGNDDIVVNYTNDSTKNWFLDDHYPYNFRDDIACWYEDENGWHQYKDADGKPYAKISEDAKNQIGKRENEHNAIYNWDNIDYIYQWTKGHGGISSTEKWEDNFSNINKRYMLSLGEFSGGISETNSQIAVKKFREYLRIQNSDDYKRYLDWLSYCKNLGIANSEADFNSWVPFSFYNWYLLDKMKINENNEDVCYIDKSRKKYMDLTSTLVNDDKNAYFCVNALCYWWLNDQSFLEEFEKYIADKGYRIINERNAGNSTESHVSSYYRAFWIYYYISKGNTYQGFNSFDDYVKSFSSSHEFNYIAAKEVYDYFVNKEQASQRETNYANFKKDCTYTNEQITHLDEAFDTIKSKVEIDAVSYANAYYSEDYLVKEMIMYVYNKTYYDIFLEDMRKATVEMSSNTRFDKKAYKDNFSQKWETYSQSVLK